MLNNVVLLLQLQELPTDIGKNNKILFAVQNQPISVWFQFVECLKSDGQESLAATLDTSLDKGKSMST